jgi:hypothetical protein
MTLKDRRRALIGAQSDILWEWNPSKGTSNINFTASSGETPLYEMMDDCVRLYRPSASEIKWTGIATKENLGFVDFTVEVYYKSLARKANGAVSVLAVTNGGGASSGLFGNASYIVNKTSASTTSVNALRGTTIKRVDLNDSIVGTGVVKCHINRSTSVLKGGYPVSTALTDTPNTAELTGKRICAVETNRKTYYADITRIVIRKGDTT